MSLSRLTSLSTQTLSLLLERQRLQMLGQTPPSSSTQHITRNLTQLRTGILELENKDGSHLEATALLRNQFERMREMLGHVDGAAVESLPLTVEETPEEPQASSSIFQPPPLSQKDHVFIPYSDEPPPSPEPEPSEMLQQQRMLMNEQDAHLDRLSNSIGRQRDISIQINGELDVHTGLLDALDHDIDNTHGRLSGAGKRLDKFRRGVKGNWSTYTIAALTFILLILIIIFKT